jgi:hypothetical protein
VHFSKNVFGKKLGASVFSSMDSSLLQFKQKKGKQKTLDPKEDNEITKPD